MYLISLAGSLISVFGSAGMLMFFVPLCLAAGCGSSSGGPSGPGPGPESGFVIDHTCADLLAIPDSAVQNAQDGIRLHYAHTSHGEQLTIGIDLIEQSDTSYDAEVGIGYLPDVADALCIFDGQASESYVTPDLYWQGEGGLDMTREVLDSNPEINVSMWAWCTQLDYYSEEEVAEYLTAMAQLESEYPGVTFVYFTGNAQAAGAEGYNRYLRNQQIRNHCVAGDKFLFDFEDLDSWWFDPDAQEWEQATAEYEGHVFPIENPHFNGDEAAHTTYESCEQKGRATWWLVARLAGWEGV
jgi:hypothetical protein